MLFLAGFPLPVSIIGRIFALIELVRSVADFIMSPVLLKIAKVASGGPQLRLGGLHEAMLITIYITIFGAVICLILYPAGGVRLRAPDLQGWIKEGKPALQSPDLAAALRRSARH